MSFAGTKQSCIPPRSRGDPWVYWSYPNRSLKDSPNCVPAYLSRHTGTEGPIDEALGCEADTKSTASAAAALLLLILMAPAANSQLLGCDDICCQCIWNRESRRQIRVRHICTENMEADGSTELLAEPVFECLFWSYYLLRTQPGLRSGGVCFGLGSGDTICVSGVCLDLG
jgi:hypothetical protein